MNRHFHSLLSLLVLLMVPLAEPAAVEPGKVTGGQMSQHPDWFKESFLDITEDVAEAAQAGKHVILFMHLNGCPYCYRMTEENFKNAPYTDFIKENFDVIAVNIKGDREIAFDENTSVPEKELARILKVRYTPTVIFLSTENKPVLRLNGYRSVEAFGHALHFVADKAYETTTLSSYIENRSKAARYSLRAHPMLKETDDLSSLGEGPVALLVEDARCDACDALHDGHLKNPEILSVLENFTFVRIDAGSEAPLKDMQGNATTPRSFAEAAGLTYRPGIILYDGGKEIGRIDGMLYSYHFQEMLRYVGERHYKTYPNSFYDYLGVRTAEILKTGKDVDLSR